MVIQRIQTLWLFIALVLMAIIGIQPIATDGATEIFLSDAPVLLVVDILVCVMLIISIFTFKNLGLQKKITILSVVLMAALACGGGFYLFRTAPAATPELVGGVVFLVLALVFALFAYRGMTHDQKLLRNSDRLWQ